MWYATEVMGQSLRRIIVLTNEESARRYASLVFDGNETHWVSTVRQARELVESAERSILNVVEGHPTFGILIDLDLPENTVGVLRWITKQFPQRWLRVVTTSQPIPEVIESGRLNGLANGYLRRPWRIDELLVAFGEPVKLEDELKRNLSRMQS